jgi:predicted DNA-binding transcriptional regulator AlpA
MTSKANDAQREFDERYITSSEIMETLGVTRTTILLARRTGKLPDPIDIQGKIFIWERDKVKDYLAAWKIVLNARRGAIA